MDLVFVYILPIIANILLLWFIRTSFAFNQENPPRRFPRFFILLIIGVSLVPVMGLICTIGLIITIIVFFANNNNYVFIIENRVTNYWLKK